jgi:hypothetical protein
MSFLPDTQLKHKKLDFIINYDIKYRMGMDNQEKG